jgi:hypothetical protein
VITPKFSAVFAIGAALENPTFKRAESTPQTTAIKIPLVIFDLFLDSVEFCNLSLSIPAFAVKATPIKEIKRPTKT